MTGQTDLTHCRTLMLIILLPSTCSSALAMLTGFYVTILILFGDSAGKIILVIKATRFSTLGYFLIDILQSTFNIHYYKNDIREV